MSLVNLILIFIVGSLLEASAKTRPYTVMLQNLEVLPENDPTFVNFKTLRSTKKGRHLHVISGDVSVEQNMGPETFVHYDVHKKRSSDEKYSRVTEGSMPICRFITTDAYTSLLPHSNFPDLTDCPFPKGNYTVKDYELVDTWMPAILPDCEGYVLTKFQQGDVVKSAYKVSFIIKNGKLD